MTNTKLNPAANGAPAKNVAAKKTSAPKTATGARRSKVQAPKAEPAHSVAAPTKPETKRATLIDLLQKPEGATIAQLTERFSWLPHTVRAALTGLRKGGHTIERTASSDGKAIYRLPVKA